MTLWDKEAPGQKKYLRYDWSAAEKKFSDGLAQFKSGIACANPIIFVEEQKNHQPQSSPAKEVALASEKPVKNPAEKQQDIALTVVELANVGASVGDPANLPPLATKESSTLPAKDDFLDDLIQPNQKSEPPKQPAPKKKSDDFLDDIFASPSPVPAPLQPASAPKAETKKATAPAQPVDTPPWETPKAETAPVTKVENKITEVKSETSAKKDSKLTALMDGFDHAQFVSVQEMINRVMNRVPDEDLDQIQGQLANYGVELHLDHYRENPRNLDEKIAEVKKNQDGIQAVRRRVAPMCDKLRLGWEVATKVGASCSAASNEAKRLGQIMSVCEDIFVRYHKAKSILDQCEQEYEHLQRQYEAVSRLTTFYTSIHKGELPSSMAPVQISHQPVVTKVFPTQLVSAQTVMVPDAAYTTKNLPSISPRAESPAPKVDDDDLLGLSAFPQNAKDASNSTVSKRGGAQILDF